MISAVTGVLAHVHDSSVELRVGPIICQLLVPASDVPTLQLAIGDEVTFHTLLYLEGDPNRGNLEPRLLGFSRREDRDFFELFTTVKGIGPKTALRALSASVGEIASAIESRNARFLTSLDGIGKRTAELIIAEIGGKTQRFVGSTPAIPGRAAAAAARGSEDEAAIAVLISPQMGLRRAEAEDLLDRVKAGHPQFTTAEQLVPAMLRLHAVRSRG
jgi:holliday junction DNA helicase RuvA